MDKINCWDFQKCQFGPDSKNPCVVTQDKKSDTFLGGFNGGRACFNIVGTRCSGEIFMNLNSKRTKICENCDFFRYIKNEEEDGTNYLKYLMHIKLNYTTKNDILPKFPIASKI